MKNLLFFFIMILISSCSEMEAPEGMRLHIEQNEVEEVSVFCGDSRSILSKKEAAHLVNEINKAKCIGPLKGIVEHRLELKLKNEESIKMRVLNNKFKWEQSADWAFELDVAHDFFDKLCARHNK